MLTDCLQRVYAIQAIVFALQHIRLMQANLQ